MARPHTVTRRRTLLASVAVLAGLAGCTDGGGDTEDGMGNGTQDAALGDETDGANDSTAGDGGDATDGGNETTGDGIETTGGQVDLRGELPSEPSDGAAVAMETEGQQYYFEPEVTWVTPGSTVTWSNESGSHSATAYAPANNQPRRIPDDAEAWDSGTLNQGGAEFAHTFETAGVYDYYCIPHESLGMLGTVIVGEPDPEGQPGLAEPQAAFGQNVADRLSALNDAAGGLLEDGSGE